MNRRKYIGILILAGLWGALLAPYLYDFFVSSKPLMRAVYGDAPKYKMVFGNSLLPFDDGHGNETKIETINNQLHLKYKSKPDGGIAAYTFAIYDPSAQTITNLYAPVNDAKYGSPLYSNGTHLINEMKNFVISTNQTSPDGYFFDSRKRVLEKRGLGRKLYVSSAVMLPHKELPDDVWRPETHHFSPKLTINEMPYKHLPFYGWIINEEGKEIPKLKHGLLVNNGPNCDADFFGVSGKRPRLKVINAQLHVTVDPKGDGGVCGFGLELYNNMYDRPEYISIKTMNLPSGTHLVEETSQYKILEKPTSPEGFTYNPKNGTLARNSENRIISGAKSFSSYARPEEFTYGWAIDEKASLPPKPKYKIAIGHVTGFFQDGGLGNFVGFETVNGKLHIKYTQAKEPPFAGYNSYAISIYDFATQSEKIVNLPLIAKSAEGWHVYEDGTHPIPELSQYTLDPNPTSPDGYTYNAEASLAIKDDNAFPLIRKEYLYHTENMPKWYEKDTAIYPQSPLQGYTAGKYKEELRLEGEFLGWVIEEE